jgi:hypothetical protein
VLANKNSFSDKRKKEKLASFAVNKDCFSE